MKVIRPISGIVLAVLASASAVAQLPTNFPAVTVTTYDSNKVAPGSLFLASWTQTPGVGSFLMVLDNSGAPVDGDKFSELPDVAGDFKMQPNGRLSYAQAIGNLTYTGGWDVEQHIADDSVTNILETIQMGNGYLCEFHDFQLLPNGNALVLGYYLSEVDMSRIVDGGHPAALVSGGVIQELDAQRNVVWQWRSWDYYDFEDEVTSQNALISEFHFNDLVLDVDGNIIVGTPTEVRKISRQTGEVLWTLGGEHNEFTIIGAGIDETDFGGHGTYRLENGNFLVYDNAHGSVGSRVLEYSLDETNRIATLVWSYTPATNINGRATGYAQRLSNGNTLICWGIPRTGNVPIVTEVTADGETVFELTFDDLSLQSYRAFRFPFPAADQKIEFTNLELATGNVYDFTDTGVSIEVLGGGGGYNEATVTREPYAPLQPAFITAKPPRILPVRVNISATGIVSLTGDVSFDADSFGFANPADLTVYQRSTPGSGFFVAVPTSYNPVTKQLHATMDQFGEFIFGHPDVADVALPPILNRPENYRGVQTNMIVAPRKAEAGANYTVNQELPILLSWSPRGFGRYSDFQLATDSSFSSPLVDLTYQTAAYYVWSNGLPDTPYFWRARSLVESNGVFVAGDWSTNSFHTIAPMLQVASPNGNEPLRTGLRFFVTWNDNIAENVIIDLYKAGGFVRSLVTNASTGAYQWQVPLDLAAGNDYSIKISSATNAALFDSSDAPFSIDAPTFDANALTHLPDGRIEFQITAPGATQATVLGSTNMLVWDEIGTMALTNGVGVFLDDNATNHLHRFYRLRVP